MGGVVDRIAVKRLRCDFGPIRERSVGDGAIVGLSNRRTLDDVDVFGPGDELG